MNTTATADGSVVRLSQVDLLDVRGTTSLLTSSNLVRIVGNGGADGSVDTLADNRPYLLGVDSAKLPLADGAGLIVPQGVTVMIDAGALLKLMAANVDVGTSALGANRSAGALQVLGTPDAAVHFHSYRNDAVGGDSDGPGEVLRPGDWGGLVFRDDAGLEQDGIFLNWVNHADLNNGGGKVLVDSLEQTFTPVDMTSARPTISYSVIRNSADAAISANPNSFEDSLGRIGPDIHDNLLVDNSINGLFIRIRTQLGEALDRLGRSRSVGRHRRGPRGVRELADWRYAGWPDARCGDRRSRRTARCATADRSGADCQAPGIAHRGRDEFAVDRGRNGRAADHSDVAQRRSVRRQREFRHQQ